MPVTRTQRLREMVAADAAGELAPDASELVHSFSDGWTIRRLATAGCVRREGALMRNCCAKYAGDTLDEKNPGVIAKRSDLADGELLEPVTDDEDELEKRALQHRHIGSELYSLRDPDGLPHVTMWGNLGLYVCDIMGCRNSKLIKWTYVDRLRQWLGPLDTPIVLIYAELIALEGRGHSYSDSCFAMRARAATERLIEMQPHRAEQHYERLRHWHKIDLESAIDWQHYGMMMDAEHPPHKDETDEQRRTREYELKWINSTMEQIELKWKWTHAQAEYELELIERCAAIAAGKDAPMPQGPQLQPQTREVLQEANAALAAAGA